MRISQKEIDAFDTERISFHAWLMRRGIELPTSKKETDKLIRVYLKLWHNDLEKWRKEYEKYRGQL